MKRDEDLVNINLAKSLNERINRLVASLKEQQLLTGGPPAPTRTELVVDLLTAAVAEAEAQRAQGQIPPAVQPVATERTMTVLVPRALQQRLQRECQQRTNELPRAQRYTVPMLHLVNFLLLPAIEQREADLNHPAGRRP
ncbi:MAG TPA: hypothetical protein VFZ66_27555 [Herpetosiphonaceae bacterium]